MAINNFKPTNGLHDDEQWLRDRHAEGKSHRDIAKLAGISTPTVRSRFKKYGIEPRNISEGMLQKSDELSARSKAYYSDPVNRKAMSVKLIQIQAGRKTELSASAKLNWSRNRASLIAAIKSRTTDVLRKRLSDGVKASWTPERLIRQSKIANDLWASVEYRTKHMLSMSRVTKSDEFKFKVSTNSKKLWADQGYRYKQAIAITNQPKISLLENITKQLLTDRGIESRQTAHGPWTFDLGFTHNGRNILIECQGDFWHRLPKTIIKDKQKKTYFDRYLSSKHELHYIYEYQFYGINKLNHIIDTILKDERPTNQFNLKDAVVGVLDKGEADEFFRAYHYLSKTNSGLDIGVKLYNKLIACCRYSGITRLQTADRLSVSPQSILELSRLCIHPEYHRPNFASWFLARTVPYIPKQIEKLVSFADEGAGHQGTVYKAAGWEYDGKTKPSYWYVDGNGHRYHKKSVWDQAKRFKISERDYAVLVGLYRINGKPVLRFIKKLK